MKLLLVEDDDVAAEAVSRAFRDSPIAMRWVKDGVEALEALRGDDAEPSVVLLDLRMPRMDGFAFLDELRADDELHGTVVFVMSTSSHPGDIEAAYRRGVAGYIIKSPDALCTAVTMLDAYDRIVELP